MTVTVDKRTMQRIVRDTQKGIAQIEEGLALMVQNETPAAYAILSQSWIELLERRRREIAQRFLPTPEELVKAHEVLSQRERRDLFYRAAQILLNGTARDGHRLTKAEALFVLLLAWNQARYRYLPKDEHLKEVEGLTELLGKHDGLLRRLRRRRIDDLKEQDKTAAAEVFADFAALLGAVGAAKALHLLAPRFFPLWDDKIAKAYGLPRRPKATLQDDAQRYWRFMQITKWQVRLLKGRENLPEFVTENFLKALDEWNYVKFTKGWL